jgi:hypothetical protein
LCFENSLLKSFREVKRKGQRKGKHFREGKKARPKSSFSLEMLYLRTKLQNDEYRKKSLGWDSPL